MARTFVFDEPESTEDGYALTWDHTQKVVVPGAQKRRHQTITADTSTALTVASAHVDCIVTLSNAAAVTVTVPQYSDDPIPVGATVDLMQLGAGQVTVAAGTGATLRVSGLTAKARAQYSRLRVTKIAADTWVVDGDVAAA